MGGGRNRGSSTSSTCDFRRSVLTDPVRKPAVEERLIGGPALGEAEVALALKRFERAREHGFADALGTNGEEAFKRTERRSADATVGREVGIILAAAVEGGQRALKEGDSDGGPHVHARVEQLGGYPVAEPGDLVEARAQPIEAAVDCGGLASRQCANWSRIGVRPRNGLRNPEAGRAAFVRRIGDIAALALDQPIDQRIHLNRLVHPRSPSESRATNQIGVL